MNETKLLYTLVGFIAGAVLIGLFVMTVGGQRHYMMNGRDANEAGFQQNYGMPGMMGNMSSSLQSKTGDEFDKAFISEMILHHQGAIDMANLALINAKHQEIKDMGTAIIDAQTKEIDQMKSWQQAWYK